VVPAAEGHRFPRATLLYVRRQCTAEACSAGDEGS
jgi:hypothetical protein